MGSEHLKARVFRFLGCVSSSSRVYGVCKVPASDENLIAEADRCVWPQGTFRQCRERSGCLTPPSASTPCRSLSASQTSLSLRPTFFSTSLLASG